MANTQSTTNGRWTQQEHQQFLIGIHVYGKNWKKIEQLVPTRNGSQIRSHAQKYFLKFKKEERNGQPSQEQQPHLDNNETFLSGSSSSNQLGSKQCSYFLHKILSYSSDSTDFDFWKACVDEKIQKDNDLQMENNKGRKNSFVQFDNQDEIIAMKNCPRKKIKQ